MKLHQLPKLVRRKKRPGRGIGGRGAKSGRGMKGQKARAGYSAKRGFEGGQTPLYLRFPKGRGTKHVSWSRIVAPAEIKTEDLNKFPPASLVNLGRLKAERLVGRQAQAVKLVNRGEVKVKLTVRVQGATAGAKKNVEEAGGKVEIVAE